jgi:hypothetical protein
MKNPRISLIIMSAILTLIFFSCNNQPKQGFQLKGKLTGISDGKAILTTYPASSSDGGEYIEPKADTVQIKNGEFTFTGNLASPVQSSLSVVGKDDYKYFWIENTEITLTGNADSLSKTIITGSILNDEAEKFMVYMKQLFIKYKLDSLYNANQIARNDELERLINLTLEKLKTEADAHRMEYIKANPASYYSAIMVEQMTYGLGAEDVEKIVNMLDPKLKETTIVENLYKLIDNLKNTDTSIGGFTSNAPDVEFAVEKSYPGKEFKDIVYLACLQNDNIFALNKEGMIWELDPNGKKINEFKSNLKASPSAIAIDPATSELYVLGSVKKEKEQKYRGKTYKYDEPVGAECKVFNSEGKQLRTLKLDSLKSVTGAKVINGKLLMADYENRKVFVCDLASGKTTSCIINLRTCCGILDFGVNSKDEILVANLGAFRVQAFDYSGKIKWAFGKRGLEINDFHGCCNPVNVTSINNGAIITVEKDPTRIKVYSKSGAKKIAGIQELVKGCTYIPMISDSKNNIYLASAQSGIVKCSAVDSPAVK